MDKQKRQSYMLRIYICSSSKKKKPPSQRVVSSFLPRLPQHPFHRYARNNHTLPNPYDWQLAPPCGLIGGVPSQAKILFPRLWDGHRRASGVLLPLQN